MKTTIQPKKLTDPRPRYSHGIVVKPGRLLFIAGQTARDEKGNIVGIGDIEAQARQVLENIKAVLEEAGGTFDDIVRTTTYLTDIRYADGLNKVRRDYFKNAPPTGTLLVISGLAQKEFLL
jgi:enamine deaminase RidA (YjgF/YER057c/UK114 family)